MFVVCWSAKGGSGTTVVASALALLLAGHAPTRLVDLTGDAIAALGMAEPTGPGITEWAAVPHATADALWRLAAPVADGLDLVPAGHAEAIDAVAWERLVTAADTEGCITVVDAGGPPPPVAHAGADRSVLVIRPCYLALRRAARCSGATDVVMVAEPGRALRAADVERAIGLPILAEVGWDPADRAGGRRRPPRHTPSRRARSRAAPLGCLHRIAGEPARGRARRVTAVFGLGPLERWLGDPEVTEVLVNAGRELWVERRATTDQPDSRGPRFVGLVEPAVVDAVVERILAPIGRRLDRTTPIVDARLPDGSRVSAVVPPVAVDGTCLAVRRFHGSSVTLDGFATGEVVALLSLLVAERWNLLVSGATSSGKTTLLGALTACIDPTERILTLEDTAELQVRAPHVLRLETRPGNADGLPAVTLTDLVRAALRLRPDRLVVGEIRGDEAVDLVQALNTGHDGSLATMHANSADDALARLASLVVRAAPGWSLPAVRQQVHRSVHAVVHLTRDVDGLRQVAEIVSVGLDRDGNPSTRAMVCGGRVVGPPVRPGRDEGR